MKCIQCNTDNTLKDRTGNNGRCKSCQHPFVFEPSTMTSVKVTDPMFAKAIADLSANHTLYFTQKQFLYFLENRLKTKGALPLAMLIFLLVFFNIWAPGFIGGILFAITGIKIFIPIVSIVVNSLFIRQIYLDSKSPKLNDRSRLKRAMALVVIGIVILMVGAIAGLLRLNSYFIFASGVVLGVTSIYLGYTRLRNPGTITSECLIAPNQLQIWLTNWSRVNAPLTHLLQPPTDSNTLATIPPDITAYSFDRLVVTDTTAIAHLLIANNFHFENNCAILSITGYPHSIFTTAMTMLRRNPELKVFAFHDCSPAGLSLVHQLRTSPTWFPTTAIEIFDIGLRPYQISAIKNAVVQTSPILAETSKRLPMEVRQALSPPELAWLDAGHTVELESFSTQRLLRVLQRGMAGNRDFSTSEDAVLDSGIYAFDSFG